MGTETVGHFSQPNRTHGYHILSGTFRFLPNFFPALLSKRYAGAVVPVRLGGSVFYIEHGSFFPSLCMQGGTNWVAWWLALCWLAAAVLVGRRGHTCWRPAHLLASALLPCMCKLIGKAMRHAAASFFYFLLFFFIFQIHMWNHNISCFIFLLLTNTCQVWSVLIHELLLES